MEQLASPRAPCCDPARSTASSAALSTLPAGLRAGKGARRGVWVTCCPQPRQDGEAVSRSPRSPAARLLLFRPHRDLTEPPSAFWPRTPALWGRCRGASPSRSHPRCPGVKPLSGGGSAPHLSPGLGTKEALPGGAGLLPPPAPCRFPAAQLPPEDAAVPAGRGKPTSPGGALLVPAPRGGPDSCSPKSLPKRPHGAFLAVPVGSG